MKKLIGALAVAGALAGCASTPTVEQDSASAQPSQPQASSGAATSPRAGAAQPNSAQASTTPRADAAAALAKRSVYFDYDSNIVKDEYQPLVSAHAGNLAQQRQARVTIQGNTDERGSREYNLALGQRRAEALKQRMTLLGASPAQIETVSFGEEKPRADDTIEQAFAENRRADIVYARE